MALAGCVAPMTAARGPRYRPDAAATNTARADCGPFAWSNTQKIKNRWLVDFEAPRQKFTVIVENDGNSSVTVWEKGIPAP